MKAVDLKLPRRIAAMVAGPLGCIYLAMWALALLTMNGGRPLAGDPRCVSLDLWPTPMWYCTGGTVAWYLANLVNAALLATLWTGVLLFGSADGAGSATVALPLLMLHAVGVPCAVYVIGCAVARLVPRKRRQAFAITGRR